MVKSLLITLIPGLTSISFSHLAISRSTESPAATAFPTAGNKYESAMIETVCQ